MKFQESQELLQAALDSTSSQEIGLGSIKIVDNEEMPELEKQTASPPSEQAPSRINVRLVPSPTDSREELMTSLENPSPAKLHSILSLDENTPNISLHDREDQLKDIKVRQVVKETRKGDFRHINTTNTMEMHNSTIMKIVVTQKRANVNSPAATDTMSRWSSHRDCASNFPNVGRSPKNAIFGSSVLINGVAMKQSNKSVTSAH